MRFKSKYHSDLYRSAFYSAQESLAKSYLESIISAARLPLIIRPLGLTEAVGIVENYYSNAGNRFDFELARVGDGKPVAKVEVTGDGILDNLARILYEKYEKMDSRTFIMYLKRKKSGGIKSVKFFSRYVIDNCLKLKVCKVDKWLEGEKPYIFIPLRYGLTDNRFANILRAMLEAMLYEG